MNYEANPKVGKSSSTTDYRWGNFVKDCCFSGVKAFALPLSVRINGNETSQGCAAAQPYLDVLSWS